MKILSQSKDHRINSKNFYVEMSFKEYLEFAPQILSNNKFQRKRVRTSKTIYSLLREDLINGCIMPPLVLAVTNFDLKDIISNEVFYSFLQDNPEKIMILDGLQRTYVLLDAYNSLKEDSTKEEQLRNFQNYTLKVEIYVNINKFGVLYRMLTLNTGQTPMSARHQIEMLYSDLNNTVFDGIKIVTDIEGMANPDNNEFTFKNVIDGFNSYMNRSELPIDRQDLLDNIRMLEKMSVESNSSDIFEDFLKSYINIFKSLQKVFGDEDILDDEIDEYQIKGAPFGRNVNKVFSTSQALTGYGAAIGKLKDFKIIKSFEDLDPIYEKIIENNSGKQWLLEMISKLDNIRENSKKIGNAQRMYFQYFFRELLNKENESYLDLDKAVYNGYEKYRSQVE